MPAPHHVLLVPGFFGFANLGDLAYFGHVRDYLAEIAPASGLEAKVRVVATSPTASLRRRAARVAEVMSEVLAAGPAEITIVGHSSGGLDARLVVSPKVSLPTTVDVERCARAVRAVVTVSTPHYGTPVAHLFNSLLGQQLLRVLSLFTIYGLRAGRLPMSVALRVAGAFRVAGVLRLAGLGRVAGLLDGREAPARGVLDQLFRELLTDFTPERRRSIDEFFNSVGSDQDLLGQITPAAMEIFNASTDDRPGVRYGCVVTRARPPGVRSAFAAGLDPYAQATHAAYVGLHRLASGGDRKHAPSLTPSQVEALTGAYGRASLLRGTDGMVPTVSQVWGEVIHAAWADHLDVIGHFDRPTHVPPHFDWLHSGSGFDRPQFEAVWRDVAAWISGSAASRVSPRRGSGPARAAPIPPTRSPA